MPTILEAAARGAAGNPQIRVPAAPEKMDGKSLWPLMAGRGSVTVNEGTTDTIFLSECAWQAARGIRKDRYKLIRTMDAGLFRRPPRELYDLERDPGETVNLADTEKERADALERELDAWIESTLAGRPDPMKQQLEQAGLPFRRRIESILEIAGIGFDEWMRHPGKARFDEAYHKRKGNSL